MMETINTLKAEVALLKKVIEDFFIDVQQKTFGKQKAEIAELKRQIHQYQAMIKADAWQPIETAPKDGTKILARDNQRGFEALMAFIGNEWEVIEFDGDEANFGYYPSHWLAIPKPPNE